MPIAFQDFVPAMSKTGGFLAPATFEPLQHTVERANAWIREEDVTVLNVETIVLPNLHSAREDGPEDPDVQVSGERASRWNQFVRVWYRQS